MPKLRPLGVLPTALRLRRLKHSQVVLLDFDIELDIIAQANENARIVERAKRRHKARQGEART